MRHEPRRVVRVGQLVLSVLVAGTVVAAVQGLMPRLLAQTPECRTGSQEAEQGLLVGFEVGADPSASGGAYIHVPDGAGSRWVPSEGHRAAFCFTVDSSNRYRLAANVWADAGTNDSFFLAVDGVMVGEGRWDVLHTTSYGVDHANSHQAADPIEFDLAAGDHLVEVYLREDGTRLDRIALEPVGLVPDCGSGWFEAERAVLQGFEIIRDRGAHANRAIEVPEGSGSRWYPSADYRAVFCLDVPSDGIYRLEADVLAPSTTSDSFFVRVDGGTAWSWFPEVSGDYASDLVAAQGIADPMEIELGAGPHAVEVFLREDGTRLDRLRFVEKPAPRGRDCRATRYEAEDGAVTGFTVGTDPSASGGAYLHGPEGSGSSWSPNDAVSATFCMRVNHAGTYELQAGVWADAGTNDSFWVKANGGTAERWDVAINTAYATDTVGFRFGADPLRLELEPGQVLVEVMLREDGTRLDWIELVEAAQP